MNIKNVTNTVIGTIKALDFSHFWVCGRIPPSRVDLKPRTQLDNGSSISWLSKTVLEKN